LAFPPIACAPGCTSCLSPSGNCQTCQTGLEISSTSPTTCTIAPSQITNSASQITCNPGTFFTPSGNTCTQCDAACTSCFGSGPNSCLQCASPRVLLGNQCVSVDNNGVCDKSSLGTNSVFGSVGANTAWIMNNAKEECDGKRASFLRSDRDRVENVLHIAIPANCTAAKIDGFSSSSSFSSLQCTSCLPGLFLSSSLCLSTCPSGTFPSNSTSSCQTCDSSCSTCFGSGNNQCTSCPAGSILVNGKCTTGTTCPSGTFLANSTVAECKACHPDCAT
jgi:hypothetical protein